MQASVVIRARDEAGAIGKTLDALAPNRSNMR
jgi:hypothetical protein